ncbi:hypothetical protein N802_06100 [Knoellia sinensis KCTC 19936]|uniref:Cytochrome oxidase assembly protein n=1 Tax=Knoellia sinensis KCTC 19936 TaxID=1385520 RepID=A0A0A0J3S2_9MICO|nr:hypothetical protein [Knoellia sinensis]KGN30777.1 hypothetical protein N802_06100 [Knoellia sinensis KCTC 19936]
MRKAYTTLGWVIAGLVLLQAASMAWGVGGQSRFIENGGVVDKALVEAARAGGEAPWPEVFGFMIHGINGGMLIPLAALALLGVSFRARLPHARRNAGILFGLVFVQIMIAYSIRDLPLLGFIHGLNALLIFAAAMVIARHTADVNDDAGGTSAAAMPPTVAGDAPLTSAEH